MKFRIGDQVRFLDEPVSGTVLAVRGLAMRQQVTVETADGFITVVDHSMLVNVHPLEKSDPVAPPIKIEDVFKKSVHPPLVDTSFTVGDPQETEIDLHIEQLGVAYRTLSSADILTLQLSVMEASLRKAIQKKMPRLILIHGVGNGILRQEIIKRLKKNPYVSQWANRGKDRLGFGATEVYFSY